MFRPRPQHGYGRAVGSKAAGRKTKALHTGKYMPEIKKTLRGIGTEIRELGKGVPRIIRGERTLHQVIRRASRKAWKVQTGRIKRR